MKLHLNLRIDAAERVTVIDRSEYDTTAINIGTPAYEGDAHFGEALYVDGTPADRAAFLRHMAEQLNAAADALDAERAGVAS